MPSHYSDMGISINSKEDMKSFIFARAKESKVHNIKGGILGVADIDGRIEFWIAGNEEWQLQAVSFNAISGNCNQLRIGEIVDKENEPFPAISAWFSSASSPGEQESFDLEYPVVFEAVNYGLLGAIPAGARCGVQLTAYAESLRIYSDDFALSQAPSPYSAMAPESLIPSGMFSPDGEDIVPPSARAIINGHILSGEHHFNSKGGLWYWHIIVTCLGCTFDILAADDLVSESPQRGGVVSGSFWLSGNILSVQKVDKTDD